jgi:hypothetical protein
MLRRSFTPLAARPPTAPGEAGALCVRVEAGEDCRDDFFACVVVVVADGVVEALEFGREQGEA